MKFLIALLTAATGVLHILVGFGLIGGMATNWLLVLNGVGYLVLLILFWMASGNGGIIRWILLAYTLITLIGYFVLNSGNNFGLDFTLGLIIKAIELLLVLLLFLYRGSERAVATTTTAAVPRAQTGMDSMRMSPTNVDTTVSTMASTTSAGVTSAAAGAALATAAMADRSVTEIDQSVDTTGDVADDVADAAGDVVDWVGDKAGDAYDATTDLAGDAADAVGDAAGATVAATGAAVGWVGDKAEDAYDATAELASDAADVVEEAVDDTGDAIRGGAVAVGATTDATMTGSEDILAAEAADLDTAQAAAEPTAEELRIDLENYLKSFGSSSEFHKDIEYIEGIGAAYGQKLRGAGINTVTDLIVNGATRLGRKHISDMTGITQSMILTWVNHVDLFRIKGVAQEYADLLEQSGVDTVVELAQRNPANLHKRMIEINEQKALVRRTPHASEVQSWVEQAKSLRRLIYY